MLSILLSWWLIVSQDIKPVTNTIEAAVKSKVETVSIKPKQPTQTKNKSSDSILFEGYASWVWLIVTGNITANGEPFIPSDYTAAHLELPFGTCVHVTNTNNNRSVVVRINDRGPYIDGRVVDLSQGAAEAIGMINSGVAYVIGREVECD